MSLKDGLSCDFVCEWFDFLQAWINSDSESHDDQETGDEPLEEDTECYDGDSLTRDGEAENDRSRSPDPLVTAPTMVTCFNCNANFLFFGTNTGWIYCFSRGERQAKGPAYEHSPVKFPIIGIEIPDDNVISLLLPHGFVMFNFEQNEILYSWFIQRSADENSLSCMVTSKCIYDNTRHRYHVFTGDSVGTVRCHNVIEDETTVIFKEGQTDLSASCPEENEITQSVNGPHDPHRHTIVQIDAYSSDLLVVSSCFRSLILWKSISESWSAIQIGRNVRKVCGQYGAVFCREGNIILAARPAMHLIKANTTDGSVVETFKLKNAKPLRTLNLFREPITSSETLHHHHHQQHHPPSTVKANSSFPSLTPAHSTSSLVNNQSNVFNLGQLIPLRIQDEHFICSWNPHSLLIIRFDGTILMKEYSSVRIIGANVSECRGFRDVLVLREDWTIFRVRFTVGKEGVKSAKTASDFGISEVLKGTLGNQNLLTLPTQALSSLEGEIKKIYTIMQDKIYESGEKLLTYTSLDHLNVLRRNSSMENQLNSEYNQHGKKDSESCSALDQIPDTEADDNKDVTLDQSTSPLYIAKRVSRKNPDNTRFDLEKNEENILFTRDLKLSRSLSNPETQSKRKSSTVQQPVPSLNGNGDYQIDYSKDSEDPEPSRHEVYMDDQNENIDDDSLSSSDVASSITSDIEVTDSRVFHDEATPARKQNSDPMFDLEELDLTRKFNQKINSSTSSSYAAEIKRNMIQQGDNILINLKFSDTIDCGIDFADSCSFFADRLSSSSSSNKLKASESIPPVDEVKTPSLGDDDLETAGCRPAHSSQPVKYVDWQLTIQDTHDAGRLGIKNCCTSGYSDIESGVYVWLTCVTKGRSRIIYYPDFETLRPPPGNNKKFIIGAIRKKIYLLNEEHELWLREGVDEISLSIGPIARPLGSFATKWTKVVPPRQMAVHFTDFSLCTTDLIGWFCDTKGDSWLYKLRTGSWQVIPHDPDNQFHIKSVRVCPTNSSLVWCIDSTNKLFVRAGIFNIRGDSDDQITGMAWLPVQTPVQVASIAITSNSVWILSKQCNRIFKRIGIEPPSSYVGTDWQEIRAPSLIEDSSKSLSASLNDDIWLLTERGSIWRVFDL